MRCEIVLTPELNRNGRRILSAMSLAAPIRASEVTRPSGTADLLMLYGVGEPTRRAWFYDHIAKGCHAIGWDLGYWGRDWDGYGNMRVTIDADHPQRWLRAMPASRFDEQDLSLWDEFDPSGHIVLVGLGRKQVRAMGIGHMAWEHSMLAKIRQIYPSREIVFRPKKDPTSALPGCRTAGIGPIENLLCGASMVVCHHSNVAIDACFAGIPVFCEDGAAAALYTGSLASPRRPTSDERLAFLRKLAWWQWNRHEAPQAWTFLLNTIKGKT